MELRYISQGFRDQQRFFAWEVYYALREPDLLHYLVLLRYVGTHSHKAFSLSDIMTETGEKGLSLAPRLAFLSEHNCLRRLSDKGDDGRRRNPWYALSDFGRCVIECIDQAGAMLELDARYQQIEAEALLRTHRPRHRYNWPKIHPLIVADMQAGITKVSILAKKYGMQRGTLYRHLKRTGLLHSLQVC